MDSERQQEELERAASLLVDPTKVELNLNGEMEIELIGQIAIILKLDTEGSTPVLK
jgi:hypothetical protein